MKQYKKQIKLYFGYKGITTYYFIYNKYHGLYNYNSVNYDFTHKGYFNYDKKYSHWLYKSWNYLNSSSFIRFKYYL